MADSDDGCAVVIVAIVGLIVGFFVLVYVVLPVALLIAGLGATWGGGHAVINYVQALQTNVRLEKPWSSP